MNLFPIRLYRIVFFIFLHESMPLEVTIQSSRVTAGTHLPEENRLRYEPCKCALK